VDEEQEGRVEVAISVLVEVAGWEEPAVEEIGDCPSALHSETPLQTQGE
jgi:hypothetical protein